MAKQATEKAEALQRMNRKHLRTLPDVKVPDAQMSARASTIKPVTLLQYLFAASRGRRSIGRSQTIRAGEEPWAHIQSY
jgi:hypothetical protein